MIPDNKTNTLYLADCLPIKYPKFFADLESVLYKYNIAFEPLPHTKDIWARDYMPIQVSDKKFIEYRYDPDYLQGEKKGYRDLKSYPDIICASINLKTEKTDLIIDGGNIVKSTDCIILTDKIVEENQYSLDRPELIKKLQALFEVEKVVLIPRDTEEPYGHADGMLRFIDDRTVLINGIYKDDQALLGELKSRQIEFHFLTFNVKKESKHNWAYINYLQTKDIILIPAMNCEEDEQALTQIKHFFPAYARNNRIAQIDSLDIVKEGGALNCISWTVKR